LLADQICQQELRRRAGSDDDNGVLSEGGCQRQRVRDIETDHEQPVLDPAAIGADAGVRQESDAAPG
jgi:hypothetical protein